MRVEGEAALPIGIRRYQPGDETEILDLFLRAFHHRRSLEHFRWKYQSDPFGREHISLAFRGNELVAHYAGYPVPFYDAGRTLPAHQIGDTMTDPSIRHIGRGRTSILGRTALHFYATFCEDRVAFNYGFNVSNIQKFSLRFLRSDRVEPVPYRVCRLEGMPWREMGGVERAIRGFTVEQVHRMDVEWDDFFHRVAPSYSFLVKRDAGYLRWRYLDCPDTNYLLLAVRKWGRLIGWSAFRLNGQTLSWGDALFDRRWPEAQALLLQTAVARTAPERINAWFPPRPGWFDAHLRELGFVTEPEPQDLSLMCVPFMQAGAVERMRAALYYTMGDGDLF